MKKEQIQTYLSTSLTKIKIKYPKENIEILVPPKGEFGNFSTNIALKLAKELKENPLVIGKKIIDNLNKKDFLKVELIKPGFINFFLNQKIKSLVLQEVINQKETYGSVNLGKNRLINYEFISANPTGYMHIGHARNAAFGDSMCRIFEFVNFKVNRQFWLNDYGNQINNMADSIHSRYMRLKDKKYPMPEDGYKGEDIKMAANVFFQEYKDKYFDKEYNAKIQKFFLEFGLKYFINEIKEDAKSINVLPFDDFMSERDFYQNGSVDTALNLLRQKNAIYLKVGAEWLKSLDFGDDKDRVLVKSDKATTYVVADIAGHIYKYNLKPYLNINVWGADHHGYEIRLKAAINYLGYDPKKLKISFIQMVRLVKDNQEFKMSKRLGTSITIKEIVNEIGSNALRYFMIYKSIKQKFDLDVDFVKSKSTNNPIYYSMYSYARSNQLLNKIELNSEKVVINFNIDLLITKYELNLLEQILIFSTIIERVVKKDDPSILATYIFDLAQCFHSFYNNCPILNQEQTLINQRYTLVLAFKQTIYNAFTLLGISPIEKM